MSVTPSHKDLSFGLATLAWGAVMNFSGCFGRSWGLVGLTLWAPSLAKFKRFKSGTCSRCASRARVRLFNIDCAACREPESNRWKSFSVVLGLPRFIGVPCASCRYGRKTFFTTATSNLEADGVVRCPLLEPLRRGEGTADSCASATFAALRLRSFGSLRDSECSLPGT